MFIYELSSQVLHFDKENLRGVLYVARLDKDFRRQNLFKYHPKNLSRAWYLLHYVTKKKRDLNNEKKWIYVGWTTHHTHPPTQPVPPGISPLHYRMICCYSKMLMILCHSLLLQMGCRYMSNKKRVKNINIILQKKWNTKLTTGFE